MPYMTDNVYDTGLNYAKNNAGRLDICSQEPATYTEATSTYTKGNKTPPTITGPADRASGGRELTIAAITDGSVTATATVTHWALSKTTATTELLATNALAASQSVTINNVFTTAACKLGIGDAVSG